MQGRLRLVFTKFRELGSVQQVLRYLARHGLKLPRRQTSGLYAGQVMWKDPCSSALYSILKNPAYAGAFGLEGFVTRLRSLAEAEQFIKAGIPLVVSMSFKKSELDGAGYGTNGHLMVIRGFEGDGDVVANDPASHLIPSNDEVQVTYDREQFENAWVPHSGGVAYVIHPSSVPLPPAPAEANW